VVTIASQDFNLLDSSGTFTTDSFPVGSTEALLTNDSASNVGGPGLDFQTFWSDTRGNEGPLSGSESGDFIGVNSFAGSNAPDVSADGTPVAAGSEQNFEFNDGDGRLDLVFEPVDISGFSNRILSFDYWINSTGYESSDRFSAVLSDGTTEVSLFDFGEVELEGNSAADDGTANWTPFTVDLEPLITSGLGETLTLTISVDTNAGSENIFIDNVAFLSDVPGGGPPQVAINELRIDQPGSDTDEYFELFGDANASLEGLFYLVIGDGSGGSGVIENVTDLSGQSLDADGVFLAAESSFSLGSADLTTSLGFENSDNVTHLLVQGFTGSNGDDLDTDDDGVLDLTPWDAVLDSVALIETPTGGDQVYSTTQVGPDGTFVPAHVFRDPDGTGAFQIGAFDPVGGNDTPGASNEFVPPPATAAAIYEIQGAGHTSALEGELVVTEGIVTALESNGFYLQDPQGDGNIATSDAIFVFTGGAPGVSVGDGLQVTGTVSEFTPGGVSTRNLSTTQISGNPEIVTLSSGNALPAAEIIGAGGRVPPTETIDDDAFGSFDPSSDGIDFFESLEGMRVTATNLVAVAGTNRFGEIFTVADLDPTTPGIQGASGISQRGTLNISPDDFNPEKIQIDFDDDILPGFSVPNVNVGAQLGDVTGVISYDFGNFQIQPTEAFSVTPAAPELQPEVTEITQGAGQLTMASYNVLNLDPNENDGDTDIANGRFQAIAAQIVNNLKAPDIIGLQEIQDNSGSADDGVVSASETLQRLVDAIASAGGPTYEVIDNTFISDGASGGQPGGNIRTAFLYNPEAVSLIEGSVQTIGGQTPGDAFFDARLPLVASFEFQGQEVTVVNNHFSSKGGSAPILGTEQPFEALQEDPNVNGSLDERIAQAQAVKDFVDGLLASNPEANVVALGDLNEFEFVSPVQDILGSSLTNLVDALPADERYSFIFQGNSQQLDHILVSDHLAAGAQFDIVHTNSEFAEVPSRASDHDPLLASLQLLNPIDGSRRGDRIVGTDKADLIHAFAGRDRIFAGGGNDRVFAGRGHDRVFGGDGNDWLDGGRGRDLVIGGNGDDILNGGRGNDWLVGDSGDFNEGEPASIAGADRFVFEGRFGNDVIVDFQAGQDQIDISALDLSFGAIDSNGDGVIDNRDKFMGQRGEDTLQVNLRPFGGGGKITVLGVSSLTAADLLV